MIEPDEFVQLFKEGLDAVLVDVPLEGTLGANTPFDGVMITKAEQTSRKMIRLELNNGMKFMLTVDWLS